MVEASVQAPAVEKAFLTFLITFVVDSEAGALQTNLTHLTKHMTENMDSQSAENLYRKQFGNLKECVLAGPTIMSVFKLDGSAFKFQTWDNIVAVNAAGNLEPAAWEKAEEGRKAHMIKMLNLCKQQNMNMCKTCNGRYYKAAEQNGCNSNDGGAHTPKYDFTLDPDNILNSEIP